MENKKTRLQQQQATRNDLLNRDTKDLLSGIV